MPFIQRSPLEYQVNSTESQRRWDDTRAPTVADYKQFKIGDLWRDASSNDWWILCYKDATQGIWRKMAGTAAAIEFLLPDAGTSPVIATAANEVTLAGGTGITTTGGLNTVTWDLDGDVLMQFTAEDATTCAPVANNVNIVGTATNGINTTAAVDTLTISMASPYSDGDFLFTNAAVATARSLSVTNTDVNAASDAYLAIVTEPLSADPFIQISINGTEQFALGIDNSDNDYLKLTNALTPSGGNEIFMADPVGSSFWIYPITLYHYSESIGGDVATFIENTDNTNAASHALLDIDVGGAAGGDPYIHFVIPATTEYSLGIDNSDADNFKLTTGATPSAGTELIEIEADATDANLNIIAILQSMASSGGTVSYTIANTDNAAAASAAALNISVGGTTSTGDPYINWLITGSTTFSLGIDNSDSDILKLTDGATPSAGNEYLAFDPATGIAYFTPHTPGFIAWSMVANRATSTGLYIENTNDTAATAECTVSIFSDPAGGDPVIKWNLQDGTTTWMMGLDNSDSDVLKIAPTNDYFATGTAWRMTRAGERTMPLQPAFNAYLPSADANETGDGTVFTLGSTTALTEVFDQGSDFNTNGTFTAPVTGRYYLQACVTIYNLGAAHTDAEFRIVTSNRTVYPISHINPAAGRSPGNFFALTGSIITDMDAADTATVTIEVSNGAKTVGINGAAPLVSYFSGKLEC